MILPGRRLIFGELGNVTSLSEFPPAVFPCAYHPCMTLKDEIKRVQKLIKIQKKLVHERRDGRPVIQGVAELWQTQLKGSKDYLKKLEALSKERKGPKRKP